MKTAWLFGGMLYRTEIRQPVTAAVAYATAAYVARRSGPPQRVAGHSLGEVTAWAWSSGLSGPDTVAVTVERGRIMAETSARNPGVMLALEGAAQSDVEAGLAMASRMGAVGHAARNGPSSWVVSGARRAVDEFRRTRGGASLELGGPWHSVLMAEATPSYEALLAPLASHMPPRGRLVRSSDRRNGFRRTPVFMTDSAGRLETTLRGLGS